MIILGNSWSESLRPAHRATKSAASLITGMSTSLFEPAFMPTHRPAPETSTKCNPKIGEEEQVHEKISLILALSASMAVSADEEFPI